MAKINEIAEGQARLEQLRKSRKGMMITIIALLALLIPLIGIYVGGTVYFSDRFFFNTEVNGVDFSRQRVTDARTFVESRADDFYLTIIDVDGQTERISASEIDFRFSANETIEDLFEAQNPFAWPLSLMNSQTAYASVALSFDEELLNARVSSLDVVTGGQTAPVSAHVMMEGNDVVITPHQYGNVVKVDVLQELLLASINNFEHEFRIDEADIFVQPELTTESSIIIDTYEHANRYLSAQITYLVGTEVLLDREVIANWVAIDDYFNVHLDEEHARAWLSEFISTVNTHGTTRSLTTPLGRNVTVTGGYYGWRVDPDAEFDQLVENIRNGDITQREPIYSQRAISHGPHDWGDTFLQVDMGIQHMWAIIDGEVVFESPVVTGLPEGRRATPEGVYFILERQRERTLIGATDPTTGEPIYRTPVAYWMRTTWSGHGFHDATWQTEFGGTRYQTHGSHGCTNLPLDAASELFDLTFIHMPVVVHY